MARDLWSAEEKARADAVIAALWDEAAFLDWADQAGPELDAEEAAQLAYGQGYRDGLRAGREYADFARGELPSVTVDEALEAAATLLGEDVADWRR